MSGPGLLGEVLTSEAGASEGSSLDRESRESLSHTVLRTGALLWSWPRLSEVDIWN